MGSVIKFGGNPAQIPSTPQLLPVNDDASTLPQLDLPAKPSIQVSTPMRKIMNVRINRKSPQTSRATEGPIQNPSSPSIIHDPNANFTPNKRKRHSPRSLFTCDNSDEEEIADTAKFRPRSLTYGEDDEMETTDEDIQEGKRRRFDGVDTIKPLEGDMNKLSIDGNDTLKELKKKITSANPDEDDNNNTTLLALRRVSTRRKTKEKKTTIDQGQISGAMSARPSNNKTPSHDSGSNDILMGGETEDTIRVIVPIITKPWILEHCPCEGGSPRNQPGRRRLRSPPIRRTVNLDEENEVDIHQNKDDTVPDGINENSREEDGEDALEDLENANENGEKGVFLFRLTAAQKYARSQKRLKQIQDYKARESREARERRSRERRRRRSFTGNGESSSTATKATKKKAVHFAI